MRLVICSVYWRQNLKFALLCVQVKLIYPRACLTTALFRWEPHVSGNFSGTKTRLYNGLEPLNLCLFGTIFGVGASSQELQVPFWTWPSHQVQAEPAVSGPRQWGSLHVSLAGTMMAWLVSHNGVVGEFGWRGSRGYALLWRPRKV